MQHFAFSITSLEQAARNAVEAFAIHPSGFLYYKFF